MFNQCAPVLKYHVMKLASADFVKGLYAHAELCTEDTCYRITFSCLLGDWHLPYHSPGCLPLTLWLWKEFSLGVKIWELIFFPYKLWLSSLKESPKWDFGEQGCMKKPSHPWTRWGRINEHCFHSWMLNPTESPGSDYKDGDAECMGRQLKFLTEKKNSFLRMETCKFSGKQNV